ncbi:hypothetical protein Hanom_Chr15g01404881 [Helianthus anomalus]
MRYVVTDREEGIGGFFLSSAARASVEWRRKGLLLMTDLKMKGCGFLVINTVFQSLLMEGKEKIQKESKNILCSRVSFTEGKEKKIKHVVFPSFI